MTSKVNIRGSLDDIQRHINEIEESLKLTKHAVKEIREYIDPGSQLWGNPPHKRDVVNK